MDTPDRAPEEREPEASDERERVAAVLDRLRAGVRQRQAEVATLGLAHPDGEGELPGDEGLQSRLLQLQQSEFLREPVPVSHRRRLGRWIVFGRKGAYHAFVKWLVRPLLEQQNAFNQAASATLRDLVQGQERLQRQLREVQARLDELERSREDGDGAPERRG